MQFFLLKERFFCKNYNFSAKTILFLANYLHISKKSSTFATQTQIYRVSANIIAMLRLRLAAFRSRCCSYSGTEAGLNGSLGSKIIY